MKGWIYVISNRAMPGLVKVGYSKNDPELRAKELNHTGSPHPYLVEYELLIDEPFNVEQRAHKILSSKREAKEWFRCTSEEAIAAIKQVAGSSSITETYKGAERAKAEALCQQQIRVKEIEQQLRSEESAIRQNFQRQLQASFPPRPFFIYWLGGASLCFIALAIFAPKISGNGSFWMSVIGGAIAGGFLQGYFENERKESSAYTSLEKQRDAKLKEVREKVVTCQSCGTNILFEGATFLLSESKTGWRCPKCKAEISAPWA